MRSVHRTAALLLAGAVLTGCGDSPAPTASDSDSRPGNMLAADERTAEGLAEGVARALADRDVRIQVRNAMRDAPFIEHKLHFQRFLTTLRGGELLRRMAAQEDVSPETLAGRIQRMRELEFYIPDEPQRVAWTGTDELYVYAITQDESETPAAVTAFDPRGEARQAYELEDLPAEAVFALVPVETDFSRPDFASMEYEGPTVQSVEQCHPRTAGCDARGVASPFDAATLQASRTPTTQLSTSSGHDATYLDYFYVNKDYDPWRGSMEIEYWVGNQSSTSKECDRFDNIDEDTEYSSTMDRHSTDQLASDSDPLESEWYEDDNGACEKTDDDDFIGDILTYPGDLGTRQDVDGHATTTFIKDWHDTSSGGGGCSDCEEEESVGSS